MSRDLGSGAREQEQTGGRPHTTIITHDQPLAVVERVPGGWFRMFRRPIRTGVWARLKPGAKALYPVMHDAADATFVVMGLTQDRMAKLAGISPSSVIRALRELVRRGMLIQRTDGRGKGEGAVYQLVTPLESEPVTGDRLKVSPVTGLIGHPRQVKEVTRDRLNLSNASGANKERTRGFTHSLETAAESKRDPVAAAAVLAELDRAGITGRPRDELASAGLSARQIREAAERMRAKGGGPGLLVNELRSLAKTSQASAANDARRVEALRRESAIREASEADLSAALEDALHDLPGDVRTDFTGNLKVDRLRLLRSPAGIDRVFASLPRRA